MTLSSEDIVRMSDAQLIEFADSQLSIVIPFGTKRTTILTRIFNSSLGVGDKDHIH